MPLRRGQIALEKLGCVERVLEYCKEVNGRMDWTPEGGPEGTERLTNKKYATQVIQRDRLVSCLLEARLLHHTRVSDWRRSVTPYSSVCHQLNRVLTTAK